MRGTIGFLALALALPIFPTLAQQCAQPAESGCPINVNQTVSTALVSPDDVNQWLLTPRQAGPVHIVLSGLAADYDLHVYRTDGTLVGESTNEGTQDDTVDLDAAPGDAFVVYVNSARGEVSEKPYTLHVTQAAGVPGRVLLSDTFDDPQNGWLPVGPLGTGIRAYINGEYQLAKTDASSNTYVAADVPGVYADASIAFDVRVADGQAGTSVLVRCRWTGGLGYRAELHPESRTFSLSRLEGDVNNSPSLVALTPSTAFVRGSTNHVEFSCVGTTISLAINGTVVTSVQDTTYTSGGYQISSGISSGKTSDVRLSNLAVTQR